MTRYDIAKFYGYNSPEEYEEAEKRNHELYVESLKRQKPYVEKEPVKIQPVKHGRWDGYICSECNECADYFVSGDFYFDEKPNFCPNCGAKMDGDRTTEYNKSEILKHLDALMICVGNAYNTSHYLLESDMKFIEKQEKIIKELLEETGK